MYDAIQARDYAIVQGFTVVIAVIYVLLNLFVDVLYGFLDPRIRYAVGILTMTAVPRPSPFELRGHSADRRARRRRMRCGPCAHTRSAIIGAVILLVLVLMAIFAPVIAPYPPNDPLIGKEPVRSREAPCIHLLGCPADRPQHMMGIDGNVRDIFSRVIYGSRVSLFIGFTTVGFAIVIGTLLGAVAGYAGGWVDNVIMRVMDVLLAFPGCCWRSPS